MAPLSSVGSSWIRKARGRLAWMMVHLCFVSLLHSMMFWHFHCNVCLSHMVPECSGVLVLSAAGTVMEQRSLFQSPCPLLCIVSPGSLWANSVEEMNTLVLVSHKRRISMQTDQWSRQDLLHQKWYWHIKRVPLRERPKNLVEVESVKHNFGRKRKKKEQMQIIRRWG